jgi:maltose O-acetyltransferase
MVEILSEIKNLFAKAIILWPDTKFGNKLRCWLYRRALGKLGANAKIESGVLFGQPNTIEIGDNCLFGRNVNVNAGPCYGIFIGNDTALAEGTYIRSANHSFGILDVPILNQGHYAKKIEYNGRFYSIVIENNVWVGAHAIILSGAKIGTGSIIGAGARVSGEIPPYSIVVGNPGVIIATREERVKRSI